MSETGTKKLIEVALPLEAINRESAREKSIRHGHPSTLHLWWARRPLAACRAMLFASIVDDPSSRPDQFPTEHEQEAERQRLFGIIEDLVKWENSTNEVVLAAARDEIVNATDGSPPAVLDPFCGGGSIPLEAQRLGFEAHASDLNPVAVLITKALIEIPPKFAGSSPVNAEARTNLGHAATWRGAQGLAEDIRFYGKWMRDEAARSIAHCYPPTRLPDGSEATPIAWLWSRTIECPNPSCGRELPLVQNLWLSRRRGQLAWLEPELGDGNTSIRFKVVSGRSEGGPGEGTATRSGARCLSCATVVPLAHVRNIGKASGFGLRLIAMVAQGTRGRIFLEANPEQERASHVASPDDAPDASLPDVALGFRVQGYGLTSFQDLYSPRQLLALTTFADLVVKVREKAREAAIEAGIHDPDAYADAVRTYVALAVSKAADLCSALCHWQPNADHLKLAPTFMRPALPMAWDFAEGNPFSDSTGNFYRQFELVAEVLDALPTGVEPGAAAQLDARTPRASRMLVATDPPYYDNIGYSDLSDFFYLWLRRCLLDVYPDLFATLLTPKEDELVAAPRFQAESGGPARAFERGLRQTFAALRSTQASGFPLILFYAFKQVEESAKDGVASTGWETMLTGLIDTGFMVTGTWPVRTERVGRPRDFQSNALASSVVLVCRPRPDNAAISTRRAFVTELRAELPRALRELQHGSIAPVDVAQAAIGPGMAIFSRYAKVIEADGSPMAVRRALGLINQVLDEILAEQDGDFDPDTRFAIAWFEQHGTADGPYGVAEVLARAKDVGVNGLVDAGILESRGGKVRLLKREELDAGWDPSVDRRLTVWEVAQHLAKRLDEHGEMAAGALLRSVGGLADPARELTYRLFSICERKGWAQEALGYNALAASWPEIARLATEPGGTEQQDLGI